MSFIVRKILGMLVLVLSSLPIGAEGAKFYESGPYDNHDYMGFALADFNLNVVEKGVASLGILGMRLDKKSIKPFLQVLKEHHEKEDDLTITPKLSKEVRWLALQAIDEWGYEAGDYFVVSAVVLDSLDTPPEDLTTFMLHAIMHDDFSGEFSYVAGTLDIDVSVSEE